MALNRKTFALHLALVVTGATFSPAWAQTGQGTISGVVKDALGGALSGAVVNATGEAGDVSFAAVSARDGSYSINVPPGRYTVTASYIAFRDQSRSGVEVAAGGSATADFSLDAKRAEEITVTATKREEELRNVPFSIAAPTGSMLSRRGAEDMEGVAANVVGFSVQNLGPGQSQIAIRGVSAGQIVRDQPGVKEQVGVYLDESTISLSLFTPDMDLFDMSRVEVLRGPQGTLFGSGSLSGTVRYITNQPELGVQRTFGEVSGGSMTGGDFGGTAKLGANLPLGDKAALRVAAYYDKLGGYMDAVQPGGGIDENVNDGERTGFRAAVRIEPNDSFTVTPRVFYQKVDMNGWNRNDAFNILGNPYTTSRPAVSLGERQLFTQFEEPFTDEFLLADLTLNIDLGEVELTSVSSYTDRDVLVVRDATALTASITGGSIGFGPEIYTLDGPLDDATQARVFTQELRLSGLTDRFSWVVGGFYSDMDRDYAQSLFVNGFETATGIPTAGDFGAGRDILFYSDLRYKFKQIALFGEGTLSVSDNFTLTAGLRYYDFDEERVQTFDGIFADPGTNPGDTTASGVAPRFLASYRAGDTTINAQVSKGFRLGGINDPLNVPLCTPQDLETFGGKDAWADETAWNYEIGTKSTILDGRGSFNASAFYIDIRDLQATVTAGSCSSRVIFNVPKSKSAGFEVEFAATPSERFDVAVSASYNDAKLRSTLTSTDSSGNSSIVAGIQEGNRLPSVPELQVAAAATYQWFTGQSVVYLTGVFQHVGSRFTQIGDQAAGFGTVNLLSFEPNTIGGPLTQDTFTFDPELPSYNILNFRLGLLRGPWDVSLFVNNVADERALLALDQERGTRARVGYLVNAPRSFGISAKLRF